MVQRGNGAGFALEALLGLEIGRKMRRKNLDGDSAFEARVAREVHFAHAASTQRGLNFIRTEFRARGEGHARAQL